MVVLVVVPHPHFGHHHPVVKVIILELVVVDQSHHWGRWQWIVIVSVMLHDVNIPVAVVIMVICSTTSSKNSSIIHRCNHLLHLTVSFQAVTEVEVPDTTLGLRNNSKIHMILVKILPIFYMVKKSLLELNSIINSIISSIMVIIIMEEESIRYLQIIGIQTIMVGMVVMVEGIRINNSSTIHHLFIRRNLFHLH